MKAKRKQIVSIGGGVWEVRADGILAKNCHSLEEAQSVCDLIELEAPCDCLPTEPDSVTVEFPGRGRQEMERTIQPDGTTVWVPGPFENGSPASVETTKSRKPKTCRECRYCSGARANSRYRVCHYHPPHPVAGGDDMPYVQVGTNDPACHVGELRDEPWPEKGERSKLECSHDMAYVLISGVNPNSTTTAHWKDGADKWMDNYRNITGYHERVAQDKTESIDD